MNDSSAASLDSVTDAKATIRSWVDKGLIYRALIIVASLAFLHVFPSILFVVYMGSRGFFDYPFFQQGMFALSVFYGTAELMVIMISLAMFGAIIPVWQRKRHRRGSWWALALSIAANVAVLAYFGYAWFQSKNGGSPEILVLFVLSLGIASHIAVVIHEPAEHAFYSLLALFTLVGCLVGITPKGVAKLLSMGLQVYNAGGNVAVVVVRGDETREGSLVFLGPEHAYVTFKGEDALTVIRRADNVQLRFSPTDK